MADTLLDSERLSRAGLPKIPTEYEPLVKMLRGAIKQIISDRMNGDDGRVVTKLIQYIKNNSNTRKKYFINAARDANLPFVFANIPKPVRSYVNKLAEKDYENDDESWLYSNEFGGNTSPVATAFGLEKLHDYFWDLRNTAFNYDRGNNKWFRGSREQYERLPETFEIQKQWFLQNLRDMESDVDKMRLKSLFGDYDLPFDIMNPLERPDGSIWNLYWNRAKLESIPTEQEVMLDPMMYSDHPNEFVSGFARKLINGEI